MSYTGLHKVTVHNEHVIEVDGKTYVSYRTCTMRFFPASNRWKCGECEGYTNAEHTDDEPPAFCPRCGAAVTKVI